MKKRMIAALLALISVILVSCSGKSLGPAAMEYDGITVTEGMYSYWLAHYKSVFLKSFPDMSDTDEFWSLEISDGMTAEQYFTSVANENIKKNIAAAWLFDYMGLKFSGSMKDDVKEGIEDLKATLTEGNEGGFETLLATYGITEDELYEIYVIDSKVNYAYNYLYGEGGVMSIPDSDKLIYTKEKYVKIEHLYINNNFKYTTVTNEIGTLTHDPETGEAYVEDLTADEKAAKDANIKAVKEGLENGESFEELWDKYSEDKLYEDGYYLTTRSTFIDEIVTAAFTLEVGEVKTLETRYGFHVIKRYEIEGTPWEDNANRDFFGSFDAEIADYVFTVMVEETAAKVSIDKLITSKFSIRTIKANNYI